MKKKLLVFLVLTLTSTALGLSEDSEVNVSIETTCSANILGYEQPGVGEQDPKLIGQGDSGFFSGTVANNGNLDIDEVNLSIEIFEILEDDLEKVDISDSNFENGTVENNTLEFVLVDGEDENDFLPSSTVSEDLTSWRDFMLEFTTDLEIGDYRGVTEAEYVCGNPTNGTTTAARDFTVLDVEGEVEVDGDGEDDDDEEEEDDGDGDDDLDEEDIFDIINETGDFDFEFNESGDVQFELNETADLELDTNDTLEILNQSDDLDVDIDLNDTDGDFDLDAELEELLEDGELRTDVQEETDADPQEGDSDAPGQTPEPEPEPEPEPIPLLSVSIKPMNSTYEIPRGDFSELGLEIENVGGETVNDLTIEPRFTDEMEWEAQQADIDSLGVDETVNESVFVNPDTSVDPGVYQIPVYASNPESDIGLQYVDVLVTEEVADAAINIQEAPRNLRFEQNDRRSIPVMVTNPGTEPLTNVQFELENAEQCGEYEVSTIDMLEPGSSSPVNIDFQTQEALEECDATLVASSEDGQFAFSEMNIDVREEIGVVPEEFRVPLVASLWTILLLAYAVLTKKYGVQNMTVKVPLVILVVGETFIILYLSSVYYEVIPPGLLPF